MSTRSPLHPAAVASFGRFTKLSRLSGRPGDARRIVWPFSGCKVGLGLTALRFACQCVSKRPLLDLCVRPSDPFGRVLARLALGPASRYLRTEVVACLHRSMQPEVLEQGQCPVIADII